MASGHNKVQLEDPQASFALPYGSITDLVLPMTMTERKWWIKRRQCKHCATRVVYASGNTSGRKEQLLVPAAFKQPLHADSDRAKNTTKALGRFIVKDMQPYAVVEDAGFQHMINVTLLEPRNTLK